MMSWLPPNVSTYGTTIDQLFYFIYYLTGVTFLGVQIALLLFLWQYRARPGGKAVYTHGNTTLEIIWTAIPAVLLAGLALAGRTTWMDIKARQPATDSTANTAYKSTVSHRPRVAKSAMLTRLTASQTGQFSMYLRPSRYWPTMLPTVGSASRRGEASPIRSSTSTRMG